MLELFFFLIVGVIAYFFYQRSRRGTVASQEANSIPSIVENLSNCAEMLAEQAKQFRTQTEIEGHYSEWFRHFRVVVSSILTSAEQFAEIDRQLEADPQLRKIFTQLDSEFSQRESRKLSSRSAGSSIDIAWIKSGPPQALQPDLDPVVDEIQKQFYAKCMKNHEEFIKKIRRHLHHQPDLKLHFERLMRDKGLGPILHKYFFS